MTDWRVLGAILFLGFAAAVAHGLAILNRWLATGKIYTR